jgi:hypothetical protein
VDAELAGGVGGGGDDPTAGGVAMATDDDRATGQLGVAEELDGGDELIQVDVEDPVHVQ